MFRLILISCLVLAVSATPKEVFRRHQHIRSIYPSGKIVGGSATPITQVPWQVALEDSGYLFCGGSIISRNYVLTAAHCTDGSSASSITIRYGTDKLQSGGTTVKVSQIFQNPQYNSRTTDYDVSVLRLASQITTSNNAQPVSLRTQEAAAGETARVSGWGTLTEGGGSLPQNLQSVNVPVVARNTCNSAYGGDVTARMICAGEAGKDSCQGDSGGAITIGGSQVGIVSWGYGCAERGYPGVYSNVAALKSYIDQSSNNEATWA